MCRNIKPLYNYDPPSTAADVEAAARQYVRKVSGYTRPSQANAAAFETAVQAVAAATQALLDELVTAAPPRRRAAAAARAQARAAGRATTPPGEHPMSDENPIVNNESAHRFEKTVEGHTAVVTYSREGDIITFHHTVVPPQLRGGGIGEELAQHVLDYARAEGLQIVPECPFIALYIRRHPAYDDLIYDPY